MISDDDLVDVIADALARKQALGDWRSAARPATAPAGSAAGERPGPPAPRAGKWGFHVRAPFSEPWTSLPMKRPFVSEHMVRQMVQKEKKKEIRLPRAAILSPLAEEWLAGRGVTVVREG